jgi:hypothetical protein
MDRGFETRSNLFLKKKKTIFTIYIELCYFWRQKIQKNECFYQIPYIELCYFWRQKIQKNECFYQIPFFSMFWSPKVTNFFFYKSKFWGKFLYSYKQTKKKKWKMCF